MSTRSCIARLTGPNAFKGVYHHWDGYPSALGATLWRLYRTVFDRNLERMLAFLIDEHPAGWSTINDADFSLAPVFSGKRPASTAGKNMPTTSSGQRGRAQAKVSPQSATCSWATRMSTITRPCSRRNATATENAAKNQIP